MSMTPVIGDAQAAYAFVTAQGRNLEAAIYRRRYPSYNYADTVPVVTEGAPWAIGTQFRVSDTTGKSRFLSGKARDIPFVKTTRELLSHDFALIGAGWEWSIEEVEQGQLYNINVNDDDAMGAADAVERHLYDIAMVGDTEKNWTGFANDPLVPTANASATGGENGGGGTSTQWIHKTADEILADINAGLSTIATQTGEVEQGDAIRIPPVAFRWMTTLRLGAGDGMITALEYVRRNNIYTAETGQALDIAPLRALADIPDGGNGGRVVYYRKAPEVLRFHLPMPRRVLPPLRVALMAFEQGVIARTGGTEVRLPNAMFYQDGVTAEVS